MGKRLRNKCGYKIHFERFLKDQTKTVSTSNMPDCVKAYELPQEIIDLISEPVISSPFNIQHNIHIEIDPNAPMGLRGLP